MTTQPKISEIITKEQIKEMLLDFICHQFLVDIDDIDPEKSLIDTGIIDSMGLIEIAAYIEQKFNIKVTEEMMIRRNFGSIMLIVDFINNNKK